MSTKLNSAAPTRETQGHDDSSGATIGGLPPETLIVTATILVCLGTVIALAVFLQFDDRGLDLFRVLVITLFTILPAVMYYVFMASKKNSLFQEFVSNLERLGLLRDQRDEQGTSNDRDGSRYFKRTRVLSYIDRFEAVYGPVGARQKRALLEASDCSPTVDAEPSRAEPADGRIFSPATAVPVFIATFLIGLGWIQFIPPLSGSETTAPSPNASLHAALLYNELPALFAFLGAYFFSLQMLYRRYVTNDLQASAFVSVCIRIILGVIGAWLLQVVFSTDAVEMTGEAYWLLFAAFVLGVFPPVLWRVIRELSSRLLIFGNIVPNLQSDLPLRDLDGLTIWHQARLEEEDIENGFNMANADVLALMVNTKMPPERIVDWVDQAILYGCFARTGGDEHDGGSRRSLAGLGIRTASALLAAVREAETDTAVRAELHERLPRLQALTLAARIGQSCNIKLIEHWRAQYPRSTTSDVSAAPVHADRRPADGHRESAGSNGAQIRQDLR